MSFSYFSFCFKIKIKIIFCVKVVMIQGIFSEPFRPLKYEQQLFEFEDDDKKEGINPFEKPFVPMQTYLYI